MAEQVHTLTCPRNHIVEVHVEDGQQAECWACPICQEDPNVESGDELVRFEVAQ